LALGKRKKNTLKSRKTAVKKALVLHENAVADERT